MRNGFIKIHIVLIIFSTVMHIIGNISRTDLLLSLIFLHLTFKKHYERAYRVANRRRNAKIG